MNNIAISGFGQYHTAKNGMDYFDLTLKGIYELVDLPDRKDKAQAQWLIPSTLHSRTHAEQTQKGEFWLLWCDFDKEPRPISDVAKMLNSLNADYEVYTSRSATEEKQKARVLIPLDKPLSGQNWLDAQEALNDWFEESDFIPDRVSERTAQLCYLPNRGQYYNAISKRDGDYFDPLKAFKQQIKRKRQRRIEQEAARKNRLTEQKVKREARLAQGFNSPIEAFNDVYSVEELLLQAGYDVKGNKFCHPNSQSGSYSASVKNGRVNSLSQSDPLYSDGKGAHDPFSVFAILWHDGDEQAAIKNACDNWLTIDGQPWNDVKQEEYWRQLTVDGFSDCSEEPKVSPFERLMGYSATGMSSELEAQMFDDKFILKNLAIFGQWTVFYAAPNTGKTLLTLWLLAEQIEADELDPSKVIYVNVDDNYRGGAEKLKLAEKYGFNMLLPGVRDFKYKDLLALMMQVVEAKQARGIVIILDTLKKFTDIMDKKKSSDFGEKARAFVNAGGSLICLAHTNKHKDADGNSIRAGTADITDDACCAYVIENMGNEELSSLKSAFTVKFRCEKSRGDVADSETFKYTKEKGAGYYALFDSIERLGQRDIEEAQERARIKNGHAKDNEVIVAVRRNLMDAELGKTALVDLVYAETDISKQNIRKVLKRWEGTEYRKGHLWHSFKKEKNLHLYKLTKGPLDHIMGLKQDQGG